MKTETKLLIAVICLSCVLGVMVGWQISAFFGASGVAAIAGATRRASKAAAEHSLQLERSSSEASDVIVDSVSSVNMDHVNAAVTSREVSFDEDFIAQPRPGSDKS